MAPPHYTLFFSFKKASWVPRTITPILKETQSISDLRTQKTPVVFFLLVFRRQRDK